MLVYWYNINQTEAVRVRFSVRVSECVLAVRAGVHLYFSAMAIVLRAGSNKTSTSLYLLRW